MTSADLPMLAASPAFFSRKFDHLRDPAVLPRHASAFPTVQMFDIASLGGWTAVQAKHFADGGLFDRIYTPGK